MTNAVRRLCMTELCCCVGHPDQGVCINAHLSVCHTNLTSYCYLRRWSSCSLRDTAIAAIWDGLRTFTQQLIESVLSRSWSRSYCMSFGPSSTCSKNYKNTRTHLFDRLTWVVFCVYAFFCVCYFNILSPDRKHSLLLPIVNSISEQLWKFAAKPL